GGVPTCRSPVLGRARYRSGTGTGGAARTDSPRRNAAAPRRGRGGPRCLGGGRRRTVPTTGSRAETRGAQSRPRVAQCDARCRPAGGLDGGGTERARGRREERAGGFLGTRGRCRMPAWGAVRFAARRRPRSTAVGCGRGAAPVPTGARCSRGRTAGGVAGTNRAVSFLVGGPEYVDPARRCGEFRAGGAVVATGRAEHDRQHQ